MIRKLRARGEAGVTLVEMLISLVIFSLVIVSVDGSVTMLSSRSNGLSQSSQSINQLQVAEQTLVQAVHAANSWCEPVPIPAYGCVTATAAPNTTANTLTFTATMSGSTTTSYQFQITGNSLVMTKNGTTSTLVSNLDPSSSKTGFTATSVTVGSTTYWNDISVILTMDSPRVGAAHVTSTTVADSDVEVWNVEYACSIAEGSSC